MYNKTNNTKNKVNNKDQKKKTKELLRIAETNEVKTKINLTERPMSINVRRRSR